MSTASAKTGTTKRPLYKKKPSVKETFQVFAVPTYTGKDIVAFRMMANWSQEQFAQFMKVSKRSITSWENDAMPIPGPAQCSLFLLKKIFADYEESSQEAMVLEND